MNLIDKIILEWSYRTDKGYPDINNPKDMDLFESMFGFKFLINENSDLVNFIKKNITSYGEVSGTGSTTIKLSFSAVPSRGPNSDSIRNTIYQELEKLAREENEITSYNKLTGGTSLGQAEVTFRGKKYKLQVKGLAADTDADTDVKEALVSLFYVSDITSPFAANNLEARANNLISIANNGIPGESSQASKKVAKYLSKLEGNNINAKFLNQPLSSALALKAAYPTGDIVRTGIFDNIRTQASTLTGLPADKWCPGDLYVKLGEVPASKYDNIELINELFADEWGATNKPLVAVSLKQEKAQGGKAKALLQKYSAAKGDYNLTKDEIEYDALKYIQGIKRLRSKVEQLVAGNENIVYKINNPDLPEDDIKKLRGKYAALKSIEFLFRKFNDGEVDEAVVALAGFALSLTGVNPTFFKLTGQSSGQAAKPEVFPKGENVILYNEDGEYDPIEIVDTYEFGGLKILFSILKGGKPYSVAINARSNGNTQGTLEIQKISAIG
jgi:hypothetical protein